MDIREFAKVAIGTQVEVIDRSDSGFGAHHFEVGQLVTYVGRDTAGDPQFQGADKVGGASIIQILTPNEIGPAPKRYVLHHVSADAPGLGAPWSVYREEYVSQADEEPIEDSTQWVSQHADEDEARAEAYRLQRLSNTAQAVAPFSGTHHADGTERGNHPGLAAKLAETPGTIAKARVLAQSWIEQAEQLAVDADEYDSAEEEERDSMSAIYSECAAQLLAIVGEA